MLKKILGCKSAVMTTIEQRLYDMSQLCPCGSGNALESCCGQFLDGKTWPDSAQTLMRSRYTAYVLGHYEWLLESTHPDYRDGISVEKLAEQGREVTWLRLEICRCEDDVPAGAEGQYYDVVEFCAYYELEGIPRQLPERSFFSRVDGKIYYVDGVPLRRQAYRRPEAKVGRNESCPCGSGRKYKKCCGAVGQV